MHRLREGLFIGLFLLLVCVSQVSSAQSATQAEPPGETSDPDESGFRVTIADPFVELHTGPSAGYPIFHVVDRGAEVSILIRKTNWFKIETGDGKTGWVSREQMRHTLQPSGQPFKVVELDASDFAERKWVMGVTTGEFASAPVFTIFGGYSLTENLVAEGHFGQSVGSISSSTFFKGNLVMQPLPDLKYSPYLTLGVGKIDVSPSSTLLAGNDDVNTFAQVGIGIQRFVSRSFLFRFEVNEYVIFSTTSTTNNNEEVNEWKFGFAVFY
ncbi:MAG: SH3 domain-containing protein [Gammaproteobacteria bacterium]|nr:SH3 domain-containing protein [Gammaproteobacteria bacterium]